MNDYTGRYFGNYQILRFIAQGSFAAVYLGEHRHIETIAAIKILLRLGPETHERFRREARTIAHLRHPHILGILEYGIEETDQTPYLVMDYSSNGTLRSVHPRGTCLPQEQIVIYAKQIAQALDYAHAQRVIHRDIKPENILLNDKHEILLSDFGIAVVQHGQDSHSTQDQAGTPLYMAPEQIQKHACAASDQYALGVMVYEWLCGEPPFRGRIFEILNAHLQEEPPSLRARMPNLSAAIEDAVFGALAKDPTKRFPTTLEFAIALEEACFATQPLVVPKNIINQTSSEPEVASSTVPASGSASDSEERVHSVFCFCAKEDLPYLSQWTKYLRLLQRAGYITIWSELDLLPGSTRLAEMTRHVQQDDLLICLISVDFLNSDECIALAEQSLQRQSTNSTRVIPLLLRPVSLFTTPLAALSYLPPDGTPICLTSNTDAAFTTCSTALCQLLGRPVITPSPPQPPPPQPPPPTLQNRARLLRRVRSQWIEGVLKHSLHGAALITLGVKTQLDAVANPWELVLYHSDTQSEPLQMGKHITEIYDKADGELLILGAPGAGKTTLLLMLARDLLARAEQNEHLPLPVIFNLSSWANKQQPLIEWLVEELKLKYGVPPKLGQALVAADYMLPLLDGLDEVALKDRTTCIRAINAYRQEHGFLPLVVCSRSADYFTQATRLRLQSAVVVQPLTSQQIDDYLATAGEPLKALRLALHKDASLRHLASTPLMLSVMTLTYHGKSVNDVLQNNPSIPLTQQIFERYVAQMLVQRRIDTRYTPQQVRYWLSQLAKQLQRRNQTTLYLERMQPDWLEEPNSSQRYPHIVVGLIFGLLGSFGLGPVGGVLLAYSFPANNPLLQHIMLLGLSLLSGLALGLIFGWVNGRYHRQDLEPEAESNGRRRSAKHKWFRRARSIQNGLLTGLLVGCPYGFYLGHGAKEVIIWILFIGTLIGILSGFIFGRIEVLLDIQTTKIQPAETFAWSWSAMARNIVKILLYGLLGSLLLSLFIGLSILATSNDKNILNDLLGGLQVTLSITIFFLLFDILLSGPTSGLSSSTLDERNTVTPNQGIRRSARHSLLIGASSAVVTSIGVALLLLGHDASTLIIMIAPLIGLISALRAGGIACLQHIVLRWSLHKDKAAPWNYPHFLDYAAEHILLCKVGGGYIFVHRLLLEYFANLDIAAPTNPQRGK